MQEQCQVAGLTGLSTRTGRPKRMRLLVRPHPVLPPAKLTALEKKTGWRYVIIATDIDRLLGPHDAAATREGPQSSPQGQNGRPITPTEPRPPMTNRGRVWIKLAEWFPNAMRPQVWRQGGPLFTATVSIASLNVIPFNRTHVSENELNYLTEVVRQGSTSGDGPFTRRAARLLREMTESNHVLLTTSCTHALEMSAILLDLRPGDEVIMPSFTFMSTANAYALRGAVPVFVDCRPDTLNVDEQLIEAAITDRTRAIVIVHYAGVACEMEAISKLCERHALALIEDNAHGLGGFYRGRPLGSFGLMAAQSFHATKNVQCGEGGALLLNDIGLIARAEIIREKGTDRSQFFRGQVDKYRWVDIGSSYLPSDVLAAQLTAQLESFDKIQFRRHAVWRGYHEGLADWAAENKVSQPTIPNGCEHPAHLYYLLLPDLENRQAFIRHLSSRGVQATFHYQPLHTAPAGVRYGRAALGGCPVTEGVADRLVRLPLFVDLGETDMAHVIDAAQTYEVS